jgi:hypothetical protein
MDPMHMLCGGILKKFFKNIMWDGSKYPLVDLPVPGLGGNTASGSSRAPATGSDVDAASEAAELSSDHGLDDDSSEDEAAAAAASLGYEAPRPEDLQAFREMAATYAAMPGRRKRAPTAKQTEAAKNQKKIFPLFTEDNKQHFHNFMQKVCSWTKHGKGSRCLPDNLSNRS